MQELLSDAELDALILARLTLAGIDLSVLPEDDSTAPADRQRILASARRFLRTTPAAVRAFPLDPQAVPPVLYPAGFAAWRTGTTSR
jgi:hypothetical protein